MERKTSKDGSVSGKCTADRDVNRTPSVKENVENNTTAAKDVLKSSKGRKVAIISIPEQTVSSTGGEGTWEGGEGEVLVGDAT